MHGRSSAVGALRAFAGTTSRGHMVSAYRLPKPPVVVFGSSSAAAMIVGYGRLVSVL